MNRWLKSSYTRSLVVKFGPESLASNSLHKPPVQVRVHKRRGACAYQFGADLAFDEDAGSGAEGGAGRAALDDSERTHGGAALVAAGWQAVLQHVVCVHRHRQQDRRGVRARPAQARTASLPLRRAHAHAMLRDVG